MKTFIYWSGGKDAAMAFMFCKAQYGYFPDLLVCRVTDNEMVAAHEISLELIQAQSTAIGIPVEFITIPAFAPNNVYEESIRKLIDRLKEDGYTQAVFGDIFLEDLKSYHLNFHKNLGIECLFPLWGKNTRLLGGEIISAGILANLSAVNTKFLNSNFAGLAYNQELLDRLPPDVDACGENGEFHTFVYNAAFFKYSIPLKILAVINKVTYNEGTAYQTEMAYITMFLDEETQ